MKVLKILGWIFAAVMGGFALLVGMLYLTGQFNQSVIEMDSLTFNELTLDGNNGFVYSSLGGGENMVMVLDDFEASISFAPDNATNKTLILKVVKGANIVTVPETVTAGQPFTIHINKDDKGNTLGGEVEIVARDARELISTSNSLKFFVDQPITSLSSTLQDMYPFTKEPITFSITANPVNSLNPTKEPEKYLEDITKSIFVETYDEQGGLVSIIDQVQHIGNNLDIASQKLESQFQFTIGRDGKTTFVFKAFDSYKLWYEYQQLQITEENFDTKKVEATNFINQYLDKIKNFSFEYDLNSLSSDQVMIGNKYKIVRFVDEEASTPENTVYQYEYQIVSTNNQPLSGIDFVQMNRDTVNENLIEIPNYATFMDAVEYLYVTSMKQVTVINDEAVSLETNSTTFMNVHDQLVYDQEDMKNQFGVRIVPSTTGSNLDSRIADIKIFTAREIDGVYQLEDIVPAQDGQQTEVEKMADLLNSPKNITNQAGRVFGVMKIENPLNDASVVVENPKNVIEWKISAYNKPNDLAQKIYLVFTYISEIKNGESNESMEVLYYSIMSVDLQQQEVESVRFDYANNSQYNDLILSTDPNGTKIGNVNFANSFLLPKDVASITYVGDQEPTYTTIKYFASKETVANNGKFVIDVDTTKEYVLDGETYYEITARDQATGQVKIQALNVSIYQNERYVPVEIFAFVVKTDIFGNVIKIDDQYINMSSVSINKMQYTVRSFLSDIYVYTNFKGGTEGGENEYYLRNNLLNDSDGIFEVDGTLYTRYSEAQTAAELTGTTPITIITTDRTIDVLVDQEFQILITNKILYTNGNDYMTASDTVDYISSYKRALEDTDLVSNLSRYIWFQYGDHEYDLEGYMRGHNPATNPDAVGEGNEYKYPGELPFTLLSSQYDAERGIIYANFKINDDAPDHYLDINYQRIVEEVDGEDGNALTDTITIDAKLNIQGYFLELDQNTSVLGGYTADHKVDTMAEDGMTEENYALFHSEEILIPVRGMVEGNLSSWKVTNYADMNEDFKTRYVQKYTNVSDDGTVDSNYPLTIKALKFNYNFMAPAGLDEGVYDETLVPDLTIEYTPYFAEKTEKDGVISYTMTDQKATEYVQLTPVIGLDGLVDVTFLGAPSSEVYIMFQCDIYAYETNDTDAISFQGKYFLKHFSFFSNNTVMSLRQDTPIFNLIQFANGQISSPITENSLTNQSVMQGGSSYLLNGTDSVVRVGFTTDPITGNVIPNGGVFNACTFSIAQEENSQKLLYFILNGDTENELTYIPAGTDISTLEIAARSTNSKAESLMFSISLLGVTKEYYITVESNISVQYNPQGNGEDGTYEEYTNNAVIEVDAESSYDLSQYFKVTQNNEIASNNNTTYQAVFYIISGQANSNYFTLDELGTVLTTGRAYQDKTLTIGIEYQILENGVVTDTQRTSSQFQVILKGNGSIQATNKEQYDFVEQNQKQIMSLSVSNGQVIDLGKYIQVGQQKDDVSQYVLNVVTSSLSSIDVEALFGTNLDQVIDGLQLSCNHYYKIVENVPVVIYFNEIFWSGQDWRTIPYETIYQLSITFQPDVVFDTIDAQILQDQSSPDQPTNWANVVLYDRTMSDNIVSLTAQGQDVFYYGYLDSEIYIVDTLDAKERTLYTGNILTIEATKDGDTTTQLRLQQNCSVQQTTYFIVVIKTKYGSDIQQEVSVTVLPNYVAQAQYPFNGTYEQVRVGTSIDLLEAYLNEFPRIYIHKENQSQAIEKVEGLITNVTAYSGAVDVTNRFTVDGSRVTLNSQNTPQQWITLQVELFNGLIVNYELERISGTSQPITLKTQDGKGSSIENPIEIYGTQVFRLSEYVGSTNLVYGTIADFKDTTLTLQNGASYQVYDRILENEAIYFNDVTTDHDLVFLLYSSNTVFGDSTGVMPLYVRVIPNLVIENRYNSMPAGHEVNLAEYVKITRGYGQEALTYGKDGIIEYNTDLFTISADGSTIQYNDNVAEQITATLSITYKQGKTYTIDLIIIPDVNFNLVEGGLTRYGSETNSTYTLTKDDWTKNGMGYTDYLGGKIGSEATIIEEISYITGNDVKAVSFQKNSSGDMEITIGAINQTVTLQLKVSYKLTKDGGVYSQTINITIRPNLQYVKNDVIVDVYAGTSIQPVINNNYLTISGTTAFSFTIVDTKATGDNITKSLMYDFSQEPDFSNKTYLDYVFVAEDGKTLCFRNVMEDTTIHIPFRIDLTGESVPYTQAYKNADFYLTIRIVPSVTNVQLTNTYQSYIDQNHAYDLLATNTNQIVVKDMVNVVGADNTTVEYMYPNFDVLIHELWKDGQRLSQVEVDTTQFVVYDKVTGILTFAPCTQEVVVAITIQLNGQFDTTCYILLSAITIDVSSKISESSADPEDQKMTMVKNNNVVGNTYTYILQYNNTDTTGYQEGVYTFDLLDLIIYPSSTTTEEETESSLKLDPSAIQVLASSTSPYLTIDMENITLTVTIPENGVVDEGTVDVYMYIGLDIYQFSIQFA